MWPRRKSFSTEEKRTRLKSKRSSFDVAMNGSPGTHPKASPTLPKVHAPCVVQPLFSLERSCVSVCVCVSASVCLCLCDFPFILYGIGLSLPLSQPLNLSSYRRIQTMCCRCLRMQRARRTCMHIMCPCSSGLMSRLVVCFIFFECNIRHFKLFFLLACMTLLALHSLALVAFLFLFSLCR